MACKILSYSFHHMRISRRIQNSCLIICHKEKELCVSYIKTTFNQRLLRKLHLSFKDFKFIAVLGSTEKFTPIPGRNTSILWDPLLNFAMNVQVTIAVVFLTLFLSEAFTCGIKILLLSQFTQNKIKCMKYIN